MAGKHPIPATWPAGFGVSSMTGIDPVRIFDRLRLFNPKFLLNGWVCLLATAFFVTNSRADVSHMPSHLRAILVDAARFHNIDKVDEIPTSVVELVGDTNGNLANPEEEWQATDVVVEPAVPAKRLLWAASDGTHVVVHYERGGRGHTYHVVVAEIVSNMATVSWRAVGGPLASYIDFLDALPGSRLDDDPQFGM